MLFFFVKLSNFILINKFKEDIQLYLNLKLKKK
jgi:hypothetical protein